MQVEHIPTLAEAVVQHGAGAAAVATVLGLLIWTITRVGRLLDRFAERLLRGDGNGGASLKKAVEAAEAAATSAHEAALSSAQVVSQMADLERRHDEAEARQVEDRAALFALRETVERLHCNDSPCGQCGAEVG